jgi:hypothetical protein
MNCPHCHSSSTTERESRTVHGFRRFQCRDCGRRYNERTGTALNRVQVPTDIVFLVVFWRLRDKLSLRDLAEMFLIRGLVFTHEAVRDWEAKLAPVLADALRKRRSGKVGRCWHTDETYVKVAGVWCYLYRAIDRDGNLVDVDLSETRDLTAAQAFFRSAKSVTQVEPELRSSSSVLPGLRRGPQCPAPDPLHQPDGLARLPTGPSCPVCRRATGPDLRCVIQLMVVSRAPTVQLAPKADRTGKRPSAQ